MAYLVIFETRSGFQDSEGPLELDAALAEVREIALNLGDKLAWAQIETEAYAEAEAGEQLMEWSRGQA